MPIPTCLNLNGLSQVPHVLTVVVGIVPQLRRNAYWGLA